MAGVAQMSEQLHPVVHEILESRGLQVLTVFQPGPRFAALLVRQGETEAVLKVALPAPRAEGDEMTVERVRMAHRNIDKEILWLQFLDEWVPESAREKFLFTRLMDYSDTETHWYLREALPGSPMAAANNPFPFPAQLYDLISPQQLFEYFSYIHSISPQTPVNLSSQFWHRWTRYDQYDHFGRWLHGMLPKVAQGKEYLGPILDYVEKHKFIMEADQTVLIHQEPFASHIFYHEGRIGLIDWENLDFGHKLYDLSVVWMRASTLR